MNLLRLPAEQDVLVWFGHPFYFIQTDGKKILADPVVSSATSPIKVTTASFKVSDRYSNTDIREIDYLFISHDHWDHLDYATIEKLKPQINKII